MSIKYTKTFFTSPESRYTRFIVKSCSDNLDNLNIVSFMLRNYFSIDTKIKDLIVNNRRYKINNIRDNIYLTILMMSNYSHTMSLPDNMNIVDKINFGYNLFMSENRNLQHFINDFVCFLNLKELFDELASSYIEIAYIVNRINVGLYWTNYTYDFYGFASNRMVNIYFLYLMKNMFIDFFGPPEIKSQITAEHINTYWNHIENSDIEKDKEYYRKINSLFLCQYGSFIINYNRKNILFPEIENINFTDLEYEAIDLLFLDIFKFFRLEKKILQQIKPSFITAEKLKKEYDANYFISDEVFDGGFSDYNGENTQKLYTKYIISDVIDAKKEEHLNSSGSVSLDNTINTDTSTDIDTDAHISKVVPLNTSSSQRPPLPAKKHKPVNSRSHRSNHKNTSNIVPIEK